MSLYSIDFRLSALIRVEGRMVIKKMRIIQIAVILTDTYVKPLGIRTKCNINFFFKLVMYSLFFILFLARKLHHFWKTDTDI